MKRNVLVVGGSKGIGHALLDSIADTHNCTNLSRTRPEGINGDFIHHDFDVLGEEELPDFDAIDALVYCPGSITLKPISTLKESDFRSDFEINVLGAFRVVKKYFRILKKSAYGNIVLFSTVAVKQGMPFHSSIASAKAGVEALAKSLAAELAPHVRVNCVAPSITDTPLASGILRSDKQRENLAQRHPLKKILKPEDVASLTRYLISDEASGITGQIIQVDAGIGSLKI